MSRFVLRRKESIQFRIIEIPAEFFVRRNVLQVDTDYIKKDDKTLDMINAEQNIDS